MCIGSLPLFEWQSCYLMYLYVSLLLLLLLWHLLFILLLCVLLDELQAYETAKATAESEGKSRFEICMQF